MGLSYASAEPDRKHRFGDCMECKHFKVNLADRRGMCEKNRWPSEDVEERKIILAKWETKPIVKIKFRRLFLMAEKCEMYSPIWLSKKSLDKNKQQ